MKMARTAALDIAYEERGPSDGRPRVIHLVTNIAIAHRNIDRFIAG
jgi:hypothetical protein